ncbi:hypothetical protein TNCV_625781 [Trichonephila clavipes]|nr:hypothetical protein TNCV_625781 [Trichonephila clavipes]
MVEQFLKNPYKSGGWFLSLRMACRSTRLPPFAPGSSPIPLVFNGCSPPSCLSPSEVEVVFRKLRGGKAPGFSVGFLRIIFSIDLSSALGKTAAALRPWTN